MWKIFVFTLYTSLYMWYIQTQMGYRPKYKQKTSYTFFRHVTKIIIHKIY